MKQLILTFSALLFILGYSRRSDAQSFHVTADTVWLTNPTALTNLHDDVVVSGSSSVSLTWHVVNTNFPSDWSDWGICDNFQCYNHPLLWTSGAYKNSDPYGSPGGDYHLQVNLDAATTLGCYYIKARLFNMSVITDSATVVFAVCKTHGTSTHVPTVAGEVSLYPNPATDEVNVVFDASSDVKNIAIYNVIGKVMSVYKVGGNSANLSLDGMPGGIYFVRLLNSAGNIVATKKFTKQ